MMHYGKWLFSRPEKFGLCVLPDFPITGKRALRALVLFQFGKFDLFTDSQKFRDVKTGYDRLSAVATKWYNALYSDFRVAENRGRLRKKSVQVLYADFPEQKFLEIALYAVLPEVE